MPYLPVLLVVVTGTVVYANALFNDFVFDDIQLVKDNDAIKSFGYVREIFTDNLWGLLGKASNYYRPLPPLLYMITYALFGLTPWAFHLVNVLLHAGVSALVYLIASRLLRQSSVADSSPVAVPALLAALVFAAHPIHTEAVTWIAGIMDVSCTFFALLSFYFFIRADERRVLSGNHGLSLASFFLATLCKEPALVLPALVLVYDYFLRSPPAKSLARSLRHVIPSVAVLGVYLAMRAYALKGLAPVTTGASDLGLYTALINIPPLFALYLQKLVVPVQQNVLYHVPPVTSLIEPRTLVGVLVAAGFCAVAILAARRHAIVSVSLAFLALPLVPALYLPALTQRLVNAFAERYEYFASVGFVLVIAAALLWVRLRHRRSYLASVGSLAIVIVLFGVLTVQRNAIWKDNYTLWSDSVSKSPLSAFAHENLGYALFYAGRTAEGRRELKTALSLDPTIPASIVATGIQYSKKGLLKKAILEFSVALMFDPDMVEAHYNLALAYHEKGWLDPAIEHYRRALALAPRFEEAHINLGTAYAEKGHLDAAIDQFEAAATLRPTDVAARYNLAKAYGAKGLQDKADEQRRIGETLEAMQRTRHAR